MAFYEETAGIHQESRISKCAWTANQADALEATLTGTQRGQAWQTHSTYFAAAELLLMNQDQPPVLRCYVFWRCLETWAALRFSDHRGLSPGSCSLNENIVLVNTVANEDHRKGQKGPKQSASRQPQLLAFELRVDKDWLTAVARVSALGRRFSYSRFQQEPWIIGNASNANTQKQQCCRKRSKQLS